MCCRSFAILHVSVTFIQFFGLCLVFFVYLIDSLAATHHGKAGHFGAMGELNWHLIPLKNELPIINESGH